LFEQVTLARQAGRTPEYEIRQGKTLHRFSFVNGVPLNQSNPDVVVNFVEYWEIRPDKTQHFSWVTDFTVTTLNVMMIMRGGRARWKVENETFNTLKNQGYHIEHSFGHGEKHLSFNFFLLNLLAFFMHQIFELTDRLYLACRGKLGSKKNLWDHLRVSMRMLIFPDWETLLRRVHAPSDFW
jgi:hypothetical protein